MRLDNKLIGGGSDRSSIERVLTLAIRRAGDRGDEAELIRLADHVQLLAESAKGTRDDAAIATVSALLAELRAAAGMGPKVHGGFLEYKDSALALAQSPDNLQVRSKRKAMQVVGYASTFGGEPDAYGDIIQVGAFAKSLAAHRAGGTIPKLFWSHDPSQVPGAWLDMREDSHGLVADGKLAGTTLGRDLNELVDMGAVDALSIGFRIPKGGSRLDGNVRILTQIELHEVSLVSLPANPRARLARTTPGDALSESLAVLAHHVSENSNVIPFPSAAAARADDDEAAACEKLNDLLAAMRLDSSLKRLRR